MKQFPILVAGLFFGPALGAFAKDEVTDQAVVEDNLPKVAREAVREDVVREAVVSEEVVEEVVRDEGARDAADAVEEDPLQEIIARIVAKLDTLKKPEDDEAGATRNRWIHSIRATVTSSYFEKESQLQTLSQTLSSLTTNLPELASEVGEVKQLLVLRAKQRESEKINELEATFEELSAVLLKAQEPEELDSWIKRLADLSGGGVSYSNYGSTGNNAELKRLQNYLRGSSQLVVYWQDYLMNRQLENLEASRRSVSSLASQVSQFPYVPRSRVLKMQAKLNSSNPFGEGSEEDAPPTSDDFIKRMDSIQSVLDVQSEIYNMGSQRRSELKVTGLYTNLEKFKNGYKMIMRGSYSSGVSYLGELQGMNVLGERATELLIVGYRRAQAIPETFKSEKGEAVESFVDRYLKSIAADPHQLWDACKVSADYFPSGTERTMLRDEVEALEYLVAAESYDEQQQFVRAIVAYRQFLAKVTRYCPTKEAVQRVAELRKEHPEAAETARGMSTHSSSIRSPYPTRLPNQFRDLIKAEVEQVLKEAGKSEKILGEG